jgi:hypothetical protein
MDFPQDSLAYNLLQPTTRQLCSVGQIEDTTRPDLPTLVASVTYVSASPRVCDLTSADTSSVRLVPPDNSCPLIDGGSNICMTSNANLLVDSVDIPPVTISVALRGGPSSFNDTITKQGFLPLTVLDGTKYFQPCYYCANMVETIISPAAVLASSDQLYFWTQIGCKDPPAPGSLMFTSRDGRLSLTFDLEYRGSLYYCTLDVFTLDANPIRNFCNRTLTTRAPGICRTLSKFSPTSKARPVESELWMLQFGSPGKHQLDVLPLHVVGTPPVFKYHPFRYIDFKEQAYICKQAAGWTADHISTRGAEFYMDFGFIRSSTEDYKRPNKTTDWIVTLYDEYLAHLIIVDGRLLTCLGLPHYI